jgi:hypothetical protein
MQNFKVRDYAIKNDEILLNFAFILPFGKASLFETYYRHSLLSLFSEFALSNIFFRIVQEDLSDIAGCTEQYLRIKITKNDSHYHLKMCTVYNRCAVYSRFSFILGLD